MKAEIIPFFPKEASRAEWKRYHTYRRLRHEETDPEDPVVEDETVEKLMKRDDPQFEIFRFAVIDADRPDTQIGSLMFGAFRKGSPTYESNKHLAQADPAVLKPYRRKGIGKRLLARAAELAGEHHKSVLISDYEEEDGKAFAEAVGADVALKGQENRLYFDQVDWEMVKQWAAEGPKRSPDSELRWCKDHVDEDILEDYSRIYTETINQQPFEDLDVNELTFTPEVLRDRESRIVDAGGTGYTAISLEANGAISGLTEMYYLPDRETIINQGMTGVKEEYRGRGLGKWLKAAMLLRVREELPQVKVVSTGNAASNEAMLSINRRLGFKIHKEIVAAQMKLEDLEAYLVQSSKASRETT